MTLDSDYSFKFSDFVHLKNDLCNQKRRKCNDITNKSSMRMIDENYNKKVKNEKKNENVEN